MSELRLSGNRHDFAVCRHKICPFQKPPPYLEGITATPKEPHFEGSINSEKMLHGLEHFRRQIARPFIIIWDRSRTHRSKLIQACLAKHPEIPVEFLPAYAPEVSPEEFCHGNVKRSTKNSVFQSKQDIRKTLNMHFAAL
jgi:transposase